MLPLVGSIGFQQLIKCECRMPSAGSRRVCNALRSCHPKKQRRPRTRPPLTGTSPKPYFSGERAEHQVQIPIVRTYQQNGMLIIELVQLLDAFPGIDCFIRETLRAYTFNPLFYFVKRLNTVRVDFHDATTAISHE